MQLQPALIWLLGAAVLLCLVLTYRELPLVGEKTPLGGSGYVQAGDQKPLDGVKVVTYHDDRAVDTTYSDSTGYFYGVQYERCMFCPRVTYTFSKPGFQPRTLDVLAYFERLHQLSGRTPCWDSIRVVLHQTGGAR
ncbi:hypothetical protein LJ737_26700 [Hymenobacter sp. 15J16-1T3B]|uniref:hypothetical protein n=1 Tax=Hymenobacter sp. 15J16-1T3B TaxID=2886941 RepID=UPI001D10EED0|nr:hypothetical protein [Hymenobacter sp. 15J16-1T3B]MCC3160856.1 hypothetical protein [Hymenobacter sp. 15J16-1T3B]